MSSTYKLCFIQINKNNRLTQKRIYELYFRSPPPQIFFEYITPYNTVRIIFLKSRHFLSLTDT